MKINAFEKELNLTSSLVRELAQIGISSVQELAELSSGYIESHFSWPKTELISLAKEKAAHLMKNEAIAASASRHSDEADESTDEYRDPNDRRIEDLHLSVRSTNALLRGGYFYISQIKDLKRDEILRLKNIGQGSVNEIIEVIQQYIAGELMLEKPSENASDDSSAAAMLLADIPVSELGLSTRGYNCLRKNGIHTVGKLSEMKEEDILKLKGLGKDTVAEIVSKLAGYTALYCNRSEDEHPIDEDKSSVQEQINFLAHELHHAWGSTLSFWITTVTKHVDTEQPFDRDAVLCTIHNDSSLYEAQESAVCHFIESNGNASDKSSITAFLADKLVPEQRVDGILQRIAAAGRIGINGDTVTRIYPSIKAYAKTLKDRQRRCLEQKLEGQTLEEIGVTEGITRERVRQIIAKALKNRPRLAEDDYVPFFERYECSMEDFLLAFGEEPFVYYYIELAANREKNRLPLMEAVEDTSLSAKMRRGIEKAAYKNYIYLDGVRVPKQRPELVQYYIRQYCAEQTNYTDFEKGYHSFLEQIGLAGDQGLTLNSRTYENRFAEDNRSVLWRKGRSFRYYEIDEIDSKTFVDALHLDRFRDVSISTLLLFRENPELMREYDIRDEYELHNLLKKLLAKEKTDITFPKMPVINFGKSDRGSQVLEVLLLYAPISANKLAAEYEKTYGFQAASALSNDFHAIEEYFHNGIYTIDSPALPPEHFEQLKAILTADYYTISDIRDLYTRTIPDADLQYINPYTLKTLGFHVYEGYVVSKRYSNAIEYFRSLLANRDIVDLNELPKSITDNGTFSGLRYDLQREHEWMEFSPNRLVSIHRLEAAGYTKADMIDYCDAVTKWVLPGTFVTPVSLRKSGFAHPLEDLGFEDWFYSSLIWMDPRFRSLRIGGTRLSVLSDRQPSFNDLLAEILQRNNDRMDIYELRSYLEEQYGIMLEKDKLVFMIRKSDMYYDSIMEAVYTDYETYYEEI